MRNFLAGLAALAVLVLVIAAYSMHRTQQELIDWSHGMKAWGDNLAKVTCDIVTQNPAGYAELTERFCEQGTDPPREPPDPPGYPD